MASNQVRDIPAENAIKLNNLLLGVLITVILGVGGYLSMQVNQINSQLTVYISKINVNDSRISTVEKRVDKLESKQ